MRTLLKKSLVAKGTAVSAVVHGSALALLIGMSWFTFRADSAYVSGRSNTISLQFEMWQQQQTQAPVPQSPFAMVIEPERAEVAGHTFTRQQIASHESDVAMLQRNVPSRKRRRTSKQTVQQQKTRQTAQPYLRKKQTTAPSAIVTPMPAGTKQGPTVVFNPPPEFPDMAKANGWYGTTLVEIEIDRTGSITAVRVLESSGYPVLDAAAVAGVKCWRFRPATFLGRAIATTETMPVTFRPATR